MEPNELKFAQDVVAIKGNDSLNDTQLMNLKTSLEANNDLTHSGINTQVLKSAKQLYSKNGSFPVELCSVNNLNKKIADFNEAGNWTGVIFAAYSIFAALFSLVITSLANRYGRKNTYMLALMAGGLGLFSMMFITDKNLLFIPMIGVGIAWGGILALPYAILSCTLPPKQTGVYMGIFNATITIPQIAASLLGGVLLTMVGDKAINVIALAGVSMLLAGIFAKIVIKSNE